ncbi:MAG: SDR family NAD(P)-dependent oxidoreductase, partial [Acidimicrobiales bacterium]
MSLRLEGHNVVVVGAGQMKGETLGIGRATALLFAREGANMMLVDRDRTAAEETLAMIHGEGGQATIHVADITSDAACKGIAAAARAELGGIDVLFNSVGILGPGLVTDIDEQLWNSVLDTNLKAMWLVTKHALGVMMEQRRGSIILVSSIG